MLFCSRVINMTLYERIRQLRINAGMTQDDLAKAMGYSDRSMITKIESGKVDISQKKILAFSRILNTTPSYLMGIDDRNSLPDEICANPNKNDEYRLLDAYRHASDEIRSAALAMLEDSAARNRKTPAV